MATKKNQMPAKDEFIGNIRKDTRSSDQNTLISGYVGDSSEANHIRVYFDEELNNFIEVNCDDIVHSKKRPTDAYPLGGSYIWVNSNAVFTYGDPAIHNRPKSSFLKGDILKSYWERFGYTPNPVGDPPRGPWVTTIVNTRSLVDGCESSLGCPYDLGQYRFAQRGNSIGVNLNDNKTNSPSECYVCPSADVCPTELRYMTDVIYPMQRIANPQRFAAFNPSWVDGCRSAMIECPINDFRIRRSLICPSRLDGCPSTPGGCFTNYIQNTTYVQQVNPAVVNTNVYRGTFNPLG